MTFTGRQLGRGLASLCLIVAAGFAARATASPDANVYNTSVAAHGLGESDRSGEAATYEFFAACPQAVHVEVKIDFFGNNTPPYAPYEADVSYWEWDEAKGANNRLLRHWSADGLANDAGTLVEFRPDRTGSTPPALRYPLEFSFDGRSWTGRINDPACPARLERRGAARNRVVTARTAAWQHAVDHPPLPATPELRQYRALIDQSLAIDRIKWDVPESYRVGSVKDVTVFRRENGTVYVKAEFYRYFDTLQRVLAVVRAGHVACLQYQGYDQCVVPGRRDPSPFGGRNPVVEAWRESVEHDRCALETGAPGLC